MALDVSRSVRELVAFLGAQMPNDQIQWQWCSLGDVRRIAAATLLADYPLPQGQLEAIIGRTRLPNLGGAADKEGRACHLFALTSPDANAGFYGLRVHYGNVSPIPSPAQLPIEALEVVFVRSAALEFVYDPGKTLRHLLPEFREQMKRESRTPFEFASRFADLGDLSGEGNSSALRK